MTLKTVSANSATDPPSPITRFSCETNATKPGRDRAAFGDDSEAAAMHDVNADERSNKVTTCERAGTVKTGSSSKS